MMRGIPRVTWRYIHQHTCWPIQPVPVHVDDVINSSVRSIHERHSRLAVSREISM